MKKTVIIKFGGTSIMNLGFPKLIDKITNDFPNKKVVCILSAIGDSTDDLVNNFKFIIEQNSTRETYSSLYIDCMHEHDMMVSQGEINSVIKANISAKAKGIKSKAMTGQQAGIQTNSSFGNALIENINVEKLQSSLKDFDLIFVAGFQGADYTGSITTLGRGASDLTAVAIAHALNLNDAYIYTDVSAIYSSDPRILPPDILKKIPKLSFEEGLEIASFGGKIIQARAVSLAQKYGIKIHFRNSENEKSTSGTIISSKFDISFKQKNSLLKAFSTRRNISHITVAAQNTPGITELIQQSLFNQEVKLSSLLQNYSKEESKIEFVITEEDTLKAKEELKILKFNDKILDYNIDEGLCEISTIGSKLETTKGFLTKFQLIFKELNIDIISLYTNGIRVSVLISMEDFDKSLKEVYLKFSQYI